MKKKKMIKNSMENDNKKHYAFISGTIGAGKSTTIESIRNLMVNYDVGIVKEYIDYDEHGEEKLNGFLTGQMSTFEFQAYIAACYHKQISTLPNKYIIMERHPMESLIFASTKLSPVELQKLYELIYNMCDMLKIPLPWQCTFKKYNTTEQSTVVRIFEDITVHSHLMCHLEISPEIQFERLLTRHRDSDINYLSEPKMKYLDKINDIYQCMTVSGYNLKPVYHKIFYRDKYDPIPYYIKEDN